MRSVVFVAGVALALGLSGSAGFAQTQQKPRLSVELGTQLADIPGLTKVETRGEITYYKKRGDKTAWKGVKLEATLYGFAGGTLDHVDLWTAKTPVTYEYGCTDVEPSREPWLAFTKKNMTYYVAQDTNLNFHDEPAHTTIQEVNALGAWNAIIDVYVIEPSEIDPDDRRLFAELTTFQWIRERRREEFTASEIRRGRAGERVPLDVHRCQHRLRFREGVTRRAIDEGDKALRELFGN